MKITEEDLRKAVEEGLSHRKLANRFGVAVMTVRRHLEKYGLSTNHAVKCRNCKCCGKELVGHQQYFCSYNCKNTFYYRTNEEVRQRKCHASTQLGFDRKKQLVDRAGGKCEICGYNKNYASLIFHHRDIATKSFGICGRNLSDKPFTRLLSEADKCMLLCHNCHTELHYPHLDYEKLAANNFVIS